MLHLLFEFRAGGTTTKNKNYSYFFQGIGFLKPEFNDLSFAVSYKEEDRPSGAESVNTSVGWYANVNFIYDNRYFADASFRTSGASTYGTDHLYSPYWSVGLGWNAQNEYFMKNAIVNLLRFRGSLGYVGSGNFGGVKPVTIYTYSPDNVYYSGMGANPTSMGNDQLKSQRTMSWNGGMNLEILEGRLGINLDFWCNLVDRSFLIFFVLTSQRISNLFNLILGMMPIDSHPPIHILFFDNLR